MSAEFPHRTGLPFDRLRDVEVRQPRWGGLPVGNESTVVAIAGQLPFLRWPLGRFRDLEDDVAPRPIGSRPPHRTTDVVHGFAFAVRVLPRFFLAASNMTRAKSTPNNATPRQPPATGPADLRVDSARSSGGLPQSGQAMSYGPGACRRRSAPVPAFGEDGLDPLVVCNLRHGAGTGVGVDDTVLARHGLAARTAPLGPEPARHLLMPHRPRRPDRRSGTSRPPTATATGCMRRGPGRPPPEQAPRSGSARWTASWRTRPGPPPRTRAATVPSPRR